MSEMTRNTEAVGQAIRNAETIAVCSHTNPDGDTLGSAAAMRLALISLGKKVTLFCDDKIPDQMNFLPGADQFRKPTGNEGPFDLLLAVDNADQGQMGACELLIPRSRHTAQIDHHPTNPLFMEINSVDGKCPSNCVLIREQIRELGVPLNREIAICLYAGLSTDTGNFSFKGTNAEVFGIMSELMRYDLPLNVLSRVLFLEKSKEQLLLMGKAINSIRFYCDGKIAVMKLTEQDFAACGAMKEHAESLVNLGLYTNGTMMAMLAREAGSGMIKISLRAKTPYFVNDVAKNLGGGGHPQASGATIAGTLDEVTERVLQTLTDKLNGNVTT